MAENPEQRQIQLRLDESKMSTTYANTVRTMTTPDEVIMDYGMQTQAQGADNQPALVLSFSDRVVMNWPNAKRLAISLGNVIRQYEERNGEIQIQQQQQAEPPAEG